MFILANREMINKLMFALSMVAVGFGLATLRSHTIHAGTSPDTPSFMNFEIGAGSDGSPVGWGGGAPNDYKRCLDTGNAHSGSGCGKIEALNAAAQGFATFTSMTNPKEYLGRRIRFTGWLKSKDITNGRAGMWLRIDGAAPGQILAFDNMNDRAVK